MVDRGPRLTYDIAQGPFVGHREASTAITAEYASADPTFQAKTAVSMLCHVKQKIRLN